MKAELIHIECGRYNGIANYKVGDHVLRFELGTPNYNDYGEYRVDTELMPIPYSHKYVGSIPANIPNIELTDEQAAWWLDVDKEIHDDMGQVAGGSTEEGIFSVFDSDYNLLPFTEWQKRTSNAHDHFMYNVLATFYKWIRSEDYMPVSGSLLIFPDL